MAFSPWFSSLTLLTKVMEDCEVLVGLWVLFLRQFEFEGRSIKSIECVNV